MIVSGWVAGILRTTRYRRRWHALAAAAQAAADDATADLDRRVRDRDRRCRPSQRPAAELSAVPGVSPGPGA